MKNLLTILAVIAVGCADAPDPTYGQAEQEVATTQGEDWNGEDWNGEDWNGEDWNGEDWNGEDWNGEDWNGTKYDGSSWTGALRSSVTRPGTFGTMSATVTATMLHVWRYRAATKTAPASWEERTPNQICYWDQSRLTKTSCTTFDLAVSPSPLAGTEFRGVFRRPDKTLFEAAVRIGRSTTDMTAVERDNTTTAMFALAGHLKPDSCEVVECDNPAGCRKNCDLWKYDVRVVDELDSRGEPQEICESATALAGTWDETGTWAASTTNFTFACASGVIAKCLRWGYRPFGSARRVNDGSNLTLLAPYHQTCVRAAAADYCGNGHSFTKNGTPIDIWDSSDGQAHFVPRTRTLFPETTAYVFEARFTPGGAWQIDHFRYKENSNIEDPEVGCPGKFIPEDPAGEGDDVGNCDSEYATDCMVGDTDVYTPEIRVDSSTSCSHDEQTVGKALHGGCSICTAKLDGNCTDPSQRWDASCVTAAQKLCTPTERMAEHSECVIGGPLSARDTGCTATVCRRAGTCCTGAWDAKCVGLANSVCRGGREGYSRFPGESVGFCGTTL